MNYACLFILVCLSALCVSAQSFRCLPADVREGDIASYRNVPEKGGGTVEVKVTVRATLKKIGARCSHGKLVDSHGRKVRFYAMQGCWGNPPEDYQAIMAKQAKEVAALKKKYRVVELACDRNSVL